MHGAERDHPSISFVLANWRHGVSPPPYGEDGRLIEGSDSRDHESPLLRTVHYTYENAPNRIRYPVEYILPLFSCLTWLTYLQFQVVNHKPDASNKEPEKVKRSSCKFAKILNAVKKCIGTKSKRRVTKQKNIDLTDD